MSFNASNGVITVVEDGGYYKLQRGSNGTKPNVTSFRIKDNTDGIYITGGSGTNSDRFTLAVHSAVPQYADQLREASKYNGDFDDAGFWDWNNEGLNGKTITTAEAQALAAYQKLQTGSSCAVFYDGNESNDSGFDSSLYYVKDDGTTGVVWWGNNIAGTVLNGYKIYVVNT